PSPLSSFSLPPPPPPTSPLFPYTTLFRSCPHPRIPSHPDSCGQGRPVLPPHSPRLHGGVLPVLLPYTFFPYCSSLSDAHVIPARSEEHTSELQSRFDLVCRLLLEKKNTNS